MKFTNSVLISDARVRQRISPRIYYFVFAGIFLIVYARGLWIPLMHNDAAHHANIALHMHNTGDYLSLIDREAEYLDKPHFLFWTSALCFKIFGVSAFAYKLTSFLFTLLGLYATYRLGSELYNRKTGILASFILATSYAFILACNDVRMDAILTSTIICAVWQLVMLCRTGIRKHAWLSALALATGFSTKGMIGILIPLLAITVYCLQNRCWRNITSVSWLITGIATVVLMMPVFVCYYIQFDMHPEKVIHGTQGHSGWVFILLGQSIDRFTGSNGTMPGAGASDPFYYLHTFLWTFLPWTPIAVTAWIKTLSRSFRKGLFRWRREIMTIVTATCTFILLCLVSSRLPHYLNILFPFVSIFTAAFVMRAKKRTIKTLLFVQQGVAVLVILLLLGLCGNYFPITNRAILIGVILLFCITVFLMFEEKLRKVNKLMLMSIALSSLIFFVLNFHYYPTILQYQAGRDLAESVRTNHIPLEQVAYLHQYETCNDFDFSLKTNIPSVTVADVEAGRRGYIITGDEGFKRLTGMNAIVVAEAWNYNVSRFSARFIDPATRASVLKKFYLLRINPAAQ